MFKFDILYYNPFQGFSIKFTLFFLFKIKNKIKKTGDVEKAD
jgi:hypothetical protein